MTPEERKKLIEEIKFTMCDGVVRGFNYRYIAEQVLAIAQAAFAKEIEAAYKEGWKEASSAGSTMEHIDFDWVHSKARASILASIPEKTK
jgi:hypothetical protein